MLNALRPALERVLIPIGRVLARAGVTPNEITAVGTLGVVGGALGLFPTGHLFAGTMVCTVFSFTDMLDGAVARITGTTGAWGAYLDSTMDRIGDASVFGGLTLWLFGGGHQPLLGGAALLCLAAGAWVSYAKARADSLGLPSGTGIAERPERMLVSLVSAGLAGLGVPYVLAVGLWLLAAASLVTFGQRVLAARRGALAAPPP